MMKDQSDRYDSVEIIEASRNLRINHNGLERALNLSIPEGIWTQITEGKPDVSIETLLENIVILTRIYNWNNPINKLNDDNAAMAKNAEFFKKLISASVINSAPATLQIPPTADSNPVNENSSPEPRSSEPTLADHTGKISARIIDTTKTKEPKQEASKALTAITADMQSLVKSMNTIDITNLAVLPDSIHFWLARINEDRSLSPKEKTAMISKLKESMSNALKARAMDDLQSAIVLGRTVIETINESPATTRHSTSDFIDFHNPLFAIAMLVAGTKSSGLADKARRKLYRQLLADPAKIARLIEDIDQLPLWEKDCRELKKAILLDLFNFLSKTSYLTEITRDGDDRLMNPNVCISERRKVVESLADAGVFAPEEDGQATHFVTGFGLRFEGENDVLGCEIDELLEIIREIDPSLYSQIVKLVAGKLSYIRQVEWPHHIKNTHQRMEAIFAKILREDNVDMTVEEINGLAKEALTPLKNKLSGNKGLLSASPSAENGNNEATDKISEQPDWTEDTERSF